MGITKTEIFTETQNDISAFAKAISHPARIAIIQNLVRRESCVCGDLVQEIGLAQPTISQHLKALKQIGLIQGTVDGTSICYCLNVETWNRMKSALNTFLQAPATRYIDCC